MLNLSAITGSVLNFDNLTHLSSASAMDVLGRFVFNGAIDFDAQPPAPSNPVPFPVQPTVTSIAREDFLLTHHDHSLLNAKSWLSGDKAVPRSPGVQTVIDHYHQYGISYKRAFLQLARGY